MPELTIQSLSHDGRGVARRDGKVAFVAGALAGERVAADLARRHRRYDDYRLIDVLEAASDRVTPPCPLVGRCGGCDLQHLAGPAQISHKSDVLLDQIRRQSGLEPEALLPALAADPFAYRRRTRLAVSLHRRGDGPESAREPTLGLRISGGTDVVPIDSCPVLVPELRAMPGILQQQLRALARPGVLGHVELSLAETDEGVSLPVVFLRLVAEPDVDDRRALSEFARDHRSYLAVRAGDGPLQYLHRPLAADPGYRLPAFDLRLSYLPGGFVQGNGSINRALVAEVVEWVAATTGPAVLDAFCGVGNFALPLARRGLDVVGLEVSTEAVVMARENAALNRLGTVSFAVQDLLNSPVLPKHQTFDTVVLDPPRTGARALIAELASRRIDNIVYVSCAPATLARDAAILAEAGYALEKLRLVDMFPQTSHIESVSMFRRRRRKG